MRKMFPNSSKHMLVVTAKPGRLAAAMDEVRTVLWMEQRVPAGKLNNFFCNGSTQLHRHANRISYDSSGGCRPGWGCAMSDRSCRRKVPVCGRPRLRSEAF